MRLRLRARRRAGVLAAAVVVGAAVLSAAAGGGSAGAAAATLPGGTWGQPQAIPGLAALTGGQYPSHGNAVSCASLGNCTAVGWYESATTANIRPFAATETGGTWGSAQPLTSAPSTALATGLDKVSCGAPGYCAASGLYTDVNGFSLAYLATEVKGAWSVRTLPGTIGPDTVLESNIGSVACTGAGDCTVVGDYTTTSNGSMVGRAFTLDESGGTWGAPQPVTGLPTGGGTSSPTATQLKSVSCSGPGDCTAGGVYAVGAAYMPILVSESGGTWGSAREVPGFAALNPAGESFGIVYSVSCPDDSDCAVAGTYKDFTSAPTSYAVFTSDEVGGTWGSAKRLGLPSQASTPSTDTVGCRAPGNCVVTGTMNVAVSWGTLTEVFAAVETSGGRWGQGQALPGIPAGDASVFQGLSCVPGGDCTVAGYYDDINGPPFRVFAATIGTDGTTWAVQPVQPAQSIEPRVTALDCPRDDYCTLVENNLGVAQLVTEVSPYRTITPARPRLAWPLTGRPASPASRLHGRPAPPAGWPRRG